MNFSSVVSLVRGEDYTAPFDRDLIGTPAALGDIVSLGIDPATPYGRIVGFDHSRTGRIVVQCWDGQISAGLLGVAYCGYCKKNAWDGPVLNHLTELLNG